MSGLVDDVHEAGYRFAFASLGRLAEVKRTIDEHRDGGLIRAELYGRQLADFDGGAPAALRGARSIVIVAVPHAKVSVSFDREGRTHRFTIPPTYLGHYDREHDRRLAGIFSKHGFGIVKAGVPLKALAVRSGLGAYGRNNVCYVDGQGSYHRLIAYFTEAPCEGDTWSEDRMLPRCSRCTLCRDACPTKAIPHDRFLLRAERCLTYMNEEKESFPGWLDPSVHHCLVGCMICQSVCPENARLSEWKEDIGHFSERETELLVSGIPLRDLPSSVVGQLELLDLVEYYDVLPRNLGVLFEKEVRA